MNSNIESSVNCKHPAQKFWLGEYYKVARHDSCEILEKNVATVFSCPKKILPKAKLQCFGINACKGDFKTA